jgi:RHS repeat-associated protein
MFQRFLYVLSFVTLISASHADPDSRMRWTMADQGITKVTSGTQYHVRMIYTEVPTVHSLEILKNGAPFASGSNTTSVGNFTTDTGNQYITYFAKARLTTQSVQTESTYLMKIYVPESVKPTKPGLQQILPHENQANQFTVRWSQSTDAAPGMLDYYKVYLNGSHVINSRSLSATVHGVSPGNVNTVHVSAVDYAENESDWSDPITFTSPTPDSGPPSQPGPLQAQQITSSSVNLSWGASSDDVAVSHYRLELRRGSVSGATERDVVVTAPGTTHDFTGLLASTTYYAQVTAIDTSGKSSLGAATTFSTQSGSGGNPGTVPTPENLRTYDITYDGFTVYWSVPAGNIARYDVYLNSQPTRHGFVTSNSFVFTGLTPGSSYTVSVVAVDSGGNTSSLSNSLSVSTLAGTPPALVSLSTLTPPVSSGSPLVSVIGAELSVDNRGGASYSVPLTVSPGRGGFQPQLSLQYSSAAGNGVVGHGWSLSTGYPVGITRGRSILARDKVTRGVRFDASDNFYLDGKRLILTDAAARTYRTEIDSFIEITADNINNPGSFVAIDRMGVRYYFGKFDNTTDAFHRPGNESADIAYTFALKRVQDTLGNHITFNYGPLGEGEYVLTSVAYTGGPNIEPLASVEFSYESRPDQATTYLLGRSFAHRARLGMITAKRNVDGTVRTTSCYVLGYQAPTFSTATGSGRSRLTTITPMYVEPGTFALRPGAATSISWTDVSLGTSAAGSTVLLNGVAPHEPERTVSWGDFDNDGRDEYRASGSTHDFEYVVVGDFDGNGTKENFAVRFMPDYANITTTGFPVNEVAFRNLFRDYGETDVGSRLLRAEDVGITSRVTVADYTGDGRDDLLVHSFDGYLNLFRSNGSSFDDPIRSAAFAGALGEVSATGTDVWHLKYFIHQHHFVRPMPMDINGDGMVDYVFTENQRTPMMSGEQIVGYVNMRTTKALFATSDGRFSPPGVINFFPMTMTGAYFTHKKLKFDEVYVGTLPGDFNGDGATDFLVLDSKGIMGYRWLLMLAKGENSDGSPDFETLPGPLPNTTQVGGATVHTYFKPASSAFWDTISEPAVALSSAPSANLFAAIENGNGSVNAEVVDVNQDGLADYVWYVAADTSDGPLPNGGWYAYLSTGKFTRAVNPSTPGTGFIGPVRVDFLDNTTGGLPVPLSTASGEYFTSTKLRRVDTNGDGHLDLVVQKYRNGRVPAEDGPAVLYELRSADRISSPPFGDLVRRITDGLNRWSEVKYLAAKDRRIYTPGSSVAYPIRELNGSNPVVASVRKDSGSDAAAEFLYQYSGNRLDLSGRGGLGFHSFVTLDKATGLFKYQFLTQSFPMTGLMHREQTYRHWASGGNENFRIISSHDNTVVFDEVSNGGAAYGTVYPFISRAVESRWENGTTANYSFSQAGPESRAEQLFAAQGTLPTGAHIRIVAESKFDAQASVQVGVPSSTKLAYSPSDHANGSNPVVGVSWYDDFVALDFPQKIRYGNLRSLVTDFGDGFTETVTTDYYDPTNGMTGLVKSIETTVTSSFGTESAPKKMYQYFRQNSTPLVSVESLDANDNRLDLTTTYDRDDRGRVLVTTVSGMDLLHGSQARSDLITYRVTQYDDRFDLPATEKNAYDYTTVTVYDSLLGKPISVKDWNNQETTSNYDALGRPTRVSFQGLVTETAYQWDATTVTGPPGITMGSAYRVAVTATQKPAITTYFDRLGRAIRTSKENYSGTTITDSVYNELGLLAARSAPYPSGGSKYWDVMQYDALGRVSTSTAPNGTVTTTVYNGRATAVTIDAANFGGRDPAPQTNTTVVDAKGRTVRVWNADNVPSFSDTKGTTSTEASISFGLDGFGRMRTTTLKGQTQTITASYDAHGRQTSLNDPDKGNWTYLNSPLGHVLEQTDGNNTVTRTTYDALGRALVRTTTEAAGPVETAKWFYYSFSADASKHLVALGEKGWVGALQREEVVTANAPGYAATASETKSIYYYNSVGLPAIKLSNIDGKWFYTHTTYDAYHRVSTVHHYWRPSPLEDPGVSPYLWKDFGYTQTWDSKSYLTAVTDSANRAWWNIHTYDHMDRPVLVQKGGAYWTRRSYREEDGMLTSIVTGSMTNGAVVGSIQNLSFNFDGLGNLTSRSNHLINATENYGYDILNRVVTRNGSEIARYFDNGNIRKKAGLDGVLSSDYSYHGSRPHAVHQAHGYTIGYDGNGNMTTRTNGSETWTTRWAGFDKPRWMAKGSIGSEFLYNAARSRTVHLEFNELNASGVPSNYTRKRIYALGPQLEVDYRNASDVNGATSWRMDRVRIYVPGPEGLVGTMEFQPAAQFDRPERALVYHYDHLGSIERITPRGDTVSGVAPDEAGKPARYSYDAWGLRQDADDWSGQAQTTASGGKSDITPRGYTGHEMLDDLGLVHMNGRIYDPLLGRMLSADIVVQAPGNLQAYNRYSYVMNNPATYTDPTGFFWDPNSGWWGASEWGIFGKAAVVDPAVDGYKSGSLSMEKGFTEWENAKTSGTPGMDRTLAVLHMLSGTGEGVGIVSDYVPGGKQVKTTANILAKNADEIAEGASKLTKALASKIDDAGTSAAKVERKLDDAAVDAKRVEVDSKAPTTADVKGGVHDETKLPVGDGKDSHHMPSRESNGGMPDSLAPAVKMDPADHAKTLSNGQSGLAGAEFRQAQGELWNSGDAAQMRQAMANEVKDVRRASRQVSGDATKYNEGMQEMLKKAKDNDVLPDNPRRPRR